MLQLQSAFGIFALLAIAWAFGENRRAVSLRQAAIGLAATLVTAVALIKLPAVAHAFGAINDALGAISAASRGCRAGDPGAAAPSRHAPSHPALALVARPAPVGARVVQAVAPLDGRRG